MTIYLSTFYIENEIDFRDLITQYFFPKCIKIWIIIILFPDSGGFQVQVCRARVDFKLNFYVTHPCIVGRKTGLWQNTTIKNNPLKSDLFCVKNCFLTFNVN